MQETVRYKTNTKAQLMRWFIPLILLLSELACELPDFSTQGAEALDTAPAPIGDAESDSVAPRWRVNTAFILDASGSMWNKVDDRYRLNVAQDAIADLGAKLPTIMNASLWVYGHRLGQADKAASCQDIEQVVPLGPVDEAHFSTVAHSFLAKGYTPITESLRQAAASLPVGDRERNTIVLLSDGEETCGGDPCALAAELAASDVGVIVYAVGFAADEATRMQLQCIADVSGGSYRDAADTMQLRFALEVIRLSLAAQQHPLDILMRWLPLLGGVILLTIGWLLIRALRRLRRKRL